MRAGTLPATAARVLELLQQRDEAVVVVEIAEVLHLHPNSIREHLDELVARGLVTRERRPATGRGRPAWVYQADPQRREPDRRVREQAALAGVLAARISQISEDPKADGRIAGTAWGEALAAGRVGRPREAVLDVLEDLDFSPQPDAGRRRILLRTCPLLDVAQAYPDVVCAVHEGMVSGLLETMGDPHDVTLEPFAAPDGCVLRLQRERGNP